MDKATLVIMAAGMGSRFGGLKQIESVDDMGHIIIDYSIYDALLAGFRRVVFIIKREIESDFKRIILPRASKWQIEVDYAFQELESLPHGYVVPKGRIKPWGTAHAISCLSGIVNTRFAVINADDFYGRNAFFRVFDFLNEDSGECCMIGYRLKDTLSDSGGVSRGVCESEQGRLINIHEVGGIIRCENRIVSADRIEFNPDTTVSMNFWCLTPEIIDECKSVFSKFLEEKLSINPLGCEFYLPEVISNMIVDRKISVKVIEANSKWYGVTYKKDKSEVALALENMINKGIYPADL